MTDNEYKQLYSLLRKYQANDCPVGGKVYNAADVVLSNLFPHYYNPNKQQEQ